MTTLRFTGHAADEMAHDGVSVAEVRAVVTTGVVLQQYQDDQPHPSRLMLGWCEGAPIHVVCANEAVDAIVVITVYRPDPRRWDETFTQRIKS